RLTPGFSAGFVPQEPRLDESTDVRGNIEQAVAPQRALLQKVEELGNKMAEASPDEMEMLMAEMDRVQAAIEAGNLGELDRGQGIPWKGNYSSWLEQKQQRLEKEEKQESARRKALARELEWAKMAPRARVAKSKARLSAYEKLAAQEYEDRPEDVQLQI